MLQIFFGHCVISCIFPTGHIVQGDMIAFNQEDSGGFWWVSLRFEEY